VTPFLEVHAAVAKVGKYASSESGDTVELIERPRGGMSLVMVDGQRSGRSAKAISNLVVHKAITLLAEGVRDGAVARAAHDTLHAQRGGQVSAELVMVSVDLVTHTLVVSRNSRCPSILLRGPVLEWLDAETNAVGIHLNTKPAITEYALEPNTTLLVFSDGVWAAGARTGERINLPALLQRIDPYGGASAECIADAVLAEALRLDQNRPHDDITVAVITVRAQPELNQVRRLVLRFPIG